MGDGLIKVEKTTATVAFLGAFGSEQYLARQLEVVSKLTRNVPPS